MELSGQLRGIGLRPLVNFLSDLNKNGRLVVRDDRWTGTISFVDGQIVGANFAGEQGLAALDAIFFALEHGSFDFNTTADCEHNVLVQPQALAEHLDTLHGEIQQLGDVVTSLSAVPGHAESIPDGEFALTRSSLALLLAVDGRRTVADHAREHGLLATLRELATLIQLGLVTMQAPAPAIEAVPPQATGVTTRSFGARPSSTTTPTNGATIAPPRSNFWHRA
ncbi:MAG: DUF4388 domain-containing protein [Chloroflexi bacterium]|nr:DUF4388 domain-containing protein [Chloroflexota bacterium]MBV9600440.1 DUF4388 domain-containing protein [Chloroflexota bacterium]